MRGSKWEKGMLLFAGITAVSIGAALVLRPEVMHAANGVTLGENASLLSEIRAPGGALLAVGVLLCVAAFVRKLVFAATVAGTVVFLGYGIGRVLSMVIDGIPASALVMACVFELVIGGLGVRSLSASRTA